MKKRNFILLFLLVVGIAFISCSKDDGGSGNSSLVGHWVYYSYEDVYNWEQNAYDFQDDGVFKVHYYEKSWDGNEFHAIGHRNDYHVGTYSLSGSTLTLKARYYVDGDNGNEKDIDKTLTFTIKTQPINSSTKSINVYNNQENRAEVWDRGSDD